MDISEARRQLRARAYGGATMSICGNGCGNPCRCPIVNGDGSHMTRCPCMNLKCRSWRWLQARGLLAEPGRTTIDGKDNWQEYNSWLVDQLNMLLAPLESEIKGLRETIQDLPHNGWCESRLGGAVCDCYKGDWNP